VLTGDRSVLYVCADRGIGSLSASLKVGGEYRVEFLPSEECADFGQQILDIADNGGFTHVVIDPGANEMLNGASRRTISKMTRDLKEKGHKIFVLLSLVTGKVGLEDDAANYARQMAPKAEVVLALHGADEGRDFGKFIDLTDVHPSMTICEDQLAILNLVTSAREAPIDWCANNKNIYSLAKALLANNLLQLAREPVMSKLANTSQAIPILESLAQDRPEHIYSHRIHSWQVTDNVMRAASIEISARNAVEQASVDSSDADLAAAARNFIRAKHKLINAQIAAKRGEN